MRRDAHPDVDLDSVVQDVVERIERTAHSLRSPVATRALGRSVHRHGRRRVARGGIVAKTWFAIVLTVKFLFVIGTLVGFAALMGWSVARLITGDVEPVIRSQPYEVRE